MRRGVYANRWIEKDEDWVFAENVFRPEWRDGVSHESWREPNQIMHHCSTKWAIFLLSLKDLVEKGKDRPGSRGTKIAVGI